MGVQFAGVVQRFGYCALGDLVEHHPVHRNRGVQDLEQVPRDGLALPVLIRGQIELIDVF